MSLVEAIGGSFLFLIIYLIILAVLAIPFILIFNIYKKLKKYRAVKTEHAKDPASFPHEKLNKEKTSLKVSVIVSTVLLLAYTIFATIFAIKQVIDGDFLLLIFVILMFGFFATPWLVVIFALICIVKYIAFKQKCKESLDPILAEKIKHKRIAAIATAVAALVFAVISFILITQFQSEIAFM